MIKPGNKMWFQFYQFLYKAKVINNLKVINKFATSIKANWWQQMSHPRAGAAG